MTRIAYVNGRYVSHNAAAVHVEDRGYQFSDGVYEVICIHQGRFIDEAGHLDRLTRSLSELRIAWPMSRRALSFVMRHLVRRNRVRDGFHLPASHARRGTPQPCLPQGDRQCPGHDDPPSQVPRRGDGTPRR